MFKVDLYPYPTTNVLDIFAKTIGIRHNHVDVVVVIAGVIDVGVPGTGVGLCDAKCRVVLGFNSV